MNNSNKKREMCRGILLLILCTALTIILLKDASATRVGIAPAYINVDYEPGAEKDSEIRIYNTDGSGLKAQLSVSGDLTEYITLNQSSVELMPGELVKPISVKIMLPERIEPGNYKSEISATVVSEGNGTVSTATVVSMQVFMYVLSEKYLAIELEISGDAKKNFVVSYKNIGQRDIANVSTVIRIFENEIDVEEIKLNDFSIKAGASKIVRKAYTNHFGDYMAKIAVNYDNEEKLLAKSFEIGNKNLEIKKVELPDFEFGKINKILVYAESNWNRNITINPKIEISSSSGIIAVIKANPFIIEKDAAIEFYWDATNVPQGTYNAKISMEYEGFTSEREFVINVKEKEAALETKEKSVFKNLAKYGIILFVIIVVIISFVFTKNIIVSKVNIIKINSLMNKAAWLAERGHLEKSAEIYAEIRQLYEKLNEKEKEKIYNKLIKLYNFIKTEKEKGGRRLHV